MVHNPAAKATVFHWRTGRAATCLHEIVPESFKGIIQCDGCSAYHAFAQSPRRQGTIHQAGCWAHVRRRFFEAREYSPDAVWVLNRIQQLYVIEEQLRESRAGLRERHAVRQEQSRPRLEEIHAQLEHWHRSHTHLPKSLTGMAISYAPGQWHTLPVFLEDGRVEIDNNLVENTIRPSAIGKKNWRFVGDAKAGDRAAAFYALLGNCRQQNIDAYAYLLDLFTRLPTLTNRQIKNITPAAWAARTNPTQSPDKTAPCQPAVEACLA